jgi:dihydropteroate synthase
MTRPEARLGGVPIGGGHAVVVMGALNVSPESFYPGSVHRDLDALVRAGVAMVRAGAAILDVGARSTAPYLATAVDLEEETGRLANAVEVLVGKVGVPVSADTVRAPAARAALEAGAVIVNDVTALADPAMGTVAAAHRASMILMASPMAAPGASASGGRPLETVRTLLAAACERARAAGIPDDQLVLDPGIGFFREEAVSWDDWDATVLGRLEALLALEHPLCVGVSRKSFLGAITGRRDPAERLPASLAATAMAVAHGAALIRTHDVAETVDAVRVAERLVAARGADR